LLNDRIGVIICFPWRGAFGDGAGMAVTAFDAGRAARDLERAGLEPAAASALVQFALENRRRGALDAVPPWLAAMLLATLLALLGWGALEIKNTGERLAVLEFNTSQLGKRMGALEEGQRKLEAQVAALEEGQRRLEEGQREMAATLEIIVSRLPQRR